MTAPALIKQADIGRAMREAKKHGAKKVHIGPDGSIDIIFVEEHLGEADILSDKQPTPERRSIIGKPDSKGEKIVL